jgi:DNA-binding transcriptional MerR regulator
VFAISVAASMVSMEIQNLRVYERRGLVLPDRTPGGSRLYSQEDIGRLHRIRELLADGLNLAGVAHVLALEERVRWLEERLAEGEASVSSHHRRSGGDARGS